VLGPAALGDEQDAARHDRDRAGDEAGLQRLVEQDERDPDGEERRGPDDDRRP
jgi:hypothetical protein